MRKNWWKLLIKKDGKRFFMRKEDVKDAVATAKELRAQGAEVEVVSAIHGFKPTRKAGPRPSSKHYWCPYCVKWRVFKYMAVTVAGVRGPEDMHCPICLISDHDYYVRRYNGLFGDVDLEMVYRLGGAVTWA